MHALDHGHSAGRHQDLTTFLARAGNSMAHIHSAHMNEALGQMKAFPSPYPITTTVWPATLPVSTYAGLNTKSDSGLLYAVRRRAV